MASLSDVGTSKDGGVGGVQSKDDDKHLNLVQVGASDSDVTAGKQKWLRRWRGVLSFLENKGDVEVRGCTPVPYDERRETKYSHMFTLWFCVSCNPLP